MALALVVGSLVFAAVWAARVYQSRPFLKSSEQTVRYELAKGMLANGFKAWEIERDLSGLAELVLNGPKPKS